MLKFNPKRVISLRGVRNPLKFLMENGFGRGTANNLLNLNNRSVKESYVERLCVLLKCTPSDLFDWQPDAKHSVADDHPLHTLRRSSQNRNPLEYLKELPLDKLDEVGIYLERLKNE